MQDPARITRVQLPVIPIIARAMADAPGTISLGQGVVSYGPPQAALDALRTFPADPLDHLYGPVEGEPDLIEALDGKLARENGIRVSPGGRIVVTAGSNLAFTNALLAIADPGDEVVLIAPYYFNHEMAVVLAGCRPIAVRSTSDYQLDVDAIAAAITSRTRAIVTVSPNNPTGAVYDEASLRAVNALCASRGVWHISDEAYEYFTYGDVRHFSPGSIAGAAGHTISLFSLSKAYGMASWRIGYMVIPDSLWDGVNKIQDTLLICAPVVSQRAAREAVRAGAAYARAHLPAIDANRQHMLTALDDPAVRCDVPRTMGAFYVFLRVRETRWSSLDLALRLVRDHRVAAIPGSAFGADDGCYLRVSFGALDDATAREGARRLAEGLKTLV